MPPFARPTAFVCLSGAPGALRKSYYGEPIESRTRVTQGTNLRLHTTTPFPQTGVGDPQSKLADTTVVCIDIMWEVTSSLPNGIIVDPLGATRLPKLG